MNQRLSRNKDKNNNTDFVSLGTGGHVTRHSPNEQPQVQVPQKATGDIKPEVPQPGAAKASPNFKKVEPNAKAQTKQDEKTVIAQNSTPVVEDEEKSEDTDA
jgi:hypothetical protein